MSAKIREKLKYKSDRFMAKGLPSLLIMLVVTTVIFLVLFTMLLLFVSRKLNMPDQTQHPFWYVFIHMLDPGTITATDSHNFIYLLVMVFITLIGLIVNSILIGTITNAIDTKLTALKAGKSKIIESGHTVIIGINETTYPMIDQLIKANINKKKECVVVIENSSYSKMTENIDANIHDKKTTSIICRGGNALDLEVLDSVSLKDAKAVIITYKDDFTTMKVLSALSQYIKQYLDNKPNFHITCLLKEQKNLEPAHYIGGNYTDVVYFKETLSRIIAHSCRYPGLLRVLDNMFNYEASELYFEKFSELEGKTFEELLSSFNNACTLGIVKNGKPLLNPPLDTKYEKGDELIVLAQDDGTATLDLNHSFINIEGIRVSEEKRIIHREKRKLLILGQNPLLANILEEFNNYIAEGSIATLAGNNIVIKEEKTSKYCNMKFDTLSIDIYDKEEVRSVLVNDGYDTVLVLCDLYNTLEDADSDVLINLANLRAIIEEENLDINIITEMRSIENEKISYSENISDFVVGSNVTNLLLTQLSENRKLFPVLKELLDEEGNEIYMRSVKNYIKSGIEVNSYQVQEVLKEKREILIGYKKYVNGKYDIEMNPNKNENITLNDTDYLIVIAED